MIPFFGTTATNTSWAYYGYSMVVDCKVLPQKSDTYLLIKKLKWFMDLMSNFKNNFTA